MVYIVVTLTLRSPLNIGFGAQQGTFAQRGMLKDRDGWPYIPASTLKGRWRHAVEQVASTLPGQNVCQTHHDMCRQDPCRVCQLFGSPWMAGRVRFVDLAMSGPPAIMALKQNLQHPKTEERTGIAVNRRRGVAQDEFLFNTELFMPGAALQFEGTLKGELNQAQAAVLIAGLNLIPALGRSKSSGLGWIDAAATVNSNAEVWTTDMLLAALLPEGASDAATT